MDDEEELEDAVAGLCTVICSFLVALAAGLLGPIPEISLYSLCLRLFQQCMLLSELPPVYRGSDWIDGSPHTSDAAIINHSLACIAIRTQNTKCIENDQTGFTMYYTVYI